MKKNLQSTPANEILVTLTGKLPQNLMIPENNAEKFTIDFLHRLSSKQLKELREVASLQNDENVFILFYIRHEGSHEASVELKDFEGFDYGKVIKINFNGNTAPLLRTDSDCVHYVSVTFTVA